jgi:hypothetical protein
MDRFDGLEARFLDAQADADRLLPHATPDELTDALSVQATLESLRRELRELKELAATLLG